MPGPNASWAVDRFLRRIRVRAVAVVGARALAAALGLGSAVFGLSAWWAGPLAPLWAVVTAWVLTALAALGAAAWALASLPRLRGGGAAALLAEHDPALVSPLRSAWELSRHAQPGTSPELVVAHLERVRLRLAKVKPAQVVPLGHLGHRTSAAGMLGLLLAALVVSNIDRASSGAWTLLHPGAHDAEGGAVAAVFEDVRARFVFPSYLGREPLLVRNPSVLEVPAGTTVELSGRSRLSASAAELQAPTGAVRMEREGGRFVGRFLASRDGTLSVRVRTSESTWVRDAALRAVRVTSDAAPTVVLLVPAEDETIEGDEELPIVFEARDDVGLESVEVVLRGADGQEHRRRASGIDVGALSARGLETIALSELGAQPGDRIELRVEARDGDDVNGPHVGRSEARTLTVASEATRREEHIAELRRALELALRALADRLERAPPEEDAAARARGAAVAASSEAARTELEALSLAARRGESRRTDAGLLGQSASALRRAILSESNLFGPTLGRLDARRRVDAQIVAALEEATLLLADLEMRARVEDAAAIARELETLRREIASLLSELRRADTPEARARLLAAISRAEQRLSDLRARLSRLGTSVPQEFANAQEQEAAQTAEALAGLREAVERNDLSEAGRMLTRLEQELDALARAVGASGEAMGEERFGPRDRALAEAMDLLQGLEAEQRELATRTGETRMSAARRALAEWGEGAEAAATRLRASATAARRALSEIDRNDLSMPEREALDAVEARLSDSEAALSTGDLGEAARMSEEAAARASELSRDLDLDSMMFPGHDLETAAAARAAREADRRVRELRDGIEEAIPDLGRHLAPPERGQMSGDGERQSAASDAAERLAERFDRGPDGAPLSPDVGGTLRQIRATMDEARQALDRADPVGASRAQDDAARRLAELRDQVEADAAGGGGGSGQSEGSGADFRRPVHIHDASEFEGPMEMRRRVLDAMHDGAPSGFEEASRRYYEGLLR